MVENKNCWLTDNCKKFKKTCGQCLNEQIPCTKLFKLDILYTESLLSDKQRKRVNLFIDPDGTDLNEFTRLSTIEQNIVQFVEEGHNIYIHSRSCGNGKTAWATRLMQAYLQAIWIPSAPTCRALFIHVPKFLLALKDSISNHNTYVDHIKTNVLSADLVVWDEIGIKALTTYEHEHLLNLINSRLDEGKANIYTSNMDSAELEEKLGDRLASRVIGLSEEIIFNGKDKRGAMIINDTASNS